jgi:hypothetical protein
VRLGSQCFIQTTDDILRSIPGFEWRWAPCVGGASQRAGVGNWWVSVQNEEFLDMFIEGMEGLTLKGIKCYVVKDSMPQGRRAYQEMPSRRVREVMDWMVA